MTDYQDLIDWIDKNLNTLRKIMDDHDFLDPEIEEDIENFRKLRVIMEKFIESDEG